MAFPRLMLLTGMLLVFSPFVSLAARLPGVSPFTTAAKFPLPGFNAAGVVGNPSTDSIVSRSLAVARVTEDDLNALELGLAGLVREKREVDRRLRARVRRSFSERARAWLAPVGSGGRGALAAGSGYSLSGWVRSIAGPAASESGVVSRRPPSLCAVCRDGGPRDLVVRDYHSTRKGYIRGAAAHQPFSPAAPVRFRRSPDFARIPVVAYRSDPAYFHHSSTEPGSRREVFVP